MLFKVGKKEVSSSAAFFGKLKRALPLTELTSFLESSLDSETMKKWSWNLRYMPLALAVLNCSFSRLFSFEGRWPCFMASKKGHKCLINKWKCRYVVFSRHCIDCTWMNPTIKPLLIEKYSICLLSISFSLFPLPSWFCGDEWRHARLSKNYQGTSQHRIQTFKVVCAQISSFCGRRGKLIFFVGLIRLHDTVGYLYLIASCRIWSSKKKDWAFQIAQRNWVCISS